MRVSRAVARLERDGLITRAADPDDGRGHLLRLRPAGRTLYARIVPMAQAREAYLLDSLSDDERKQLLRSLAVVQERAEQLTAAGLISAAASAAANLAAGRRADAAEGAPPVTGSCHAERPSSRCPCASCAVSKMCGATPRSRSASPSLLRRKALVV